jgi:hypothetical protein
VQTRGELQHDAGALDLRDAPVDATHREDVIALTKLAYDRAVCCLLLALRAHDQQVPSTCDRPQQY